MKPLVIYHANCTDGFTAAWIAARALGDVELYPGFYGSEPPDVTGRDVYVLDFSWKRPMMERLIEQARSVVVLDHHKTAQADLEGLVCGGDVKNPRIIFDMGRSGARLAWDFFHPEMLDGWVPGVVAYVEDRDLWRWRLPHSRLVSAAIEAVEKTLDAWTALSERPLPDLIRDGEPIERYRRICIEAATSLARMVLLEGHYVLAANSSEMRFASDTAHELAAGYPYAVTYWIRADGLVQYSLRSREDGVDVSEIAKRRGGGGHKHAAGFQSSLDELTDLLRKSTVPPPPWDGRP